MQPAIPNAWNGGSIIGTEGVAMIRGVSGPQTGWAGGMDQSAPFSQGGASYYDGTSWQYPQSILNPDGSLFGGVLGKVSFPYGDATNGWASNLESYLCFLLTLE
jgi:hypothetical protein